MWGLPWGLVLIKREGRVEGIPHAADPREGCLLWGVNKGLTMRIT